MNKKDCRSRSGGNPAEKMFRVADQPLVSSRYASDCLIDWIPAPRLRGGRLCAGMTQREVLGL